MYFNEIKEIVLSIVYSKDPSILLLTVFISYILFFLLLRILFLSTFFKKLRKADKRANRAIIRDYLSSSLFGWVLFFIGAILAEFLYLKPQILLKYFDFYFWVSIILLIPFLATIAHLFNFTKALLKYLVTKLEIEKN